MGHFYLEKAISYLALGILFLANFISLGQSGLQDKPCGFLYNEQNFTGHILEIKDTSNYANLEEMYVTTDTVWNVTNSFQVEKGCLLTVCNGSFFDGVCQEFSQDVQETPLQFDSLLSVNCTCAAECKCSDIHMRRTSCARAYVGKGCNTCNSYYTDLKGSKAFVPDVFKNSIASIIVRKGCSLTLYDEEDFEGEEFVIEGSTLENWSRSISSYECLCTEGPLVTPQPKIRPPGSPPFIDVPLNADNISALLDTELGNLTGIGKHPGLLAALRSIKVKRSPRNAYILLLGLTGAGKSSAINLLFDNENVTRVGEDKSTTSDIHEFRIPVPIDYLGIQNSELRIIDTPGLGDTRGLEQDAKFLSTLEDYLDNHEELSKRIPNIVLVFAKFIDNRFDGEGSTFVKMLRGVDSFRERITDKKFSNVIFVLSHFMSSTKETRRRPGRILSSFKNVIEQYSLFPKPVSIVVAENKAAEQELPILNGYYKLPNGEFYPRNLFEKIEVATVNGGDPIGEAIVRSAFSNSDDFNISSTTHKLVGSGHRKVIQYLAALSGAQFNPENTEISQILGSAYESMNPKISQKYPDALPYLQVAFNIRNIITTTDLPKTTLEIVKFMRDIRKNEATLFLMETAFGLKSPNFSEDIITGHGYDIINDRPLPSSPYLLGDLINTDIGYMMPGGMTCSIESISIGIFNIYANKENYLKARLQGLNVEESVPVSSFKGQVRPGSNILNSSFNENGEIVTTAVKEHRTFELVLNDRLKLAPEFINTVQNLTKFNSSDYENVETWKKFFHEYGTHVVKSAHGGGSIEISLASNKTFGPEIAQAMFEIIEFAEDVTNIGKIKNTTFDTSETRHTLKFRGGDPKYHATNLRAMSLTEAAEVFENWKESLELNPSILMTEMLFLPISDVAKKVGSNYSAEIQMAAQELFNSTLRVQTIKNKDYVPGDRQETGKDNNNFNQGNLGLILQQMAETNRRSDERMNNMLMMIQETNAEREKLRDIERREQIEWQKELELIKMQRDDKDREAVQARLEAAEIRRAEEVKRQAAQAERLAQQLRNHEIQMATMKTEADERQLKLILQIAEMNKPQKPWYQFW